MGSFFCEISYAERKFVTQTVFDKNNSAIEEILFKVSPKFIQQYFPQATKDAMEPPQKGGFPHQLSLNENISFFKPIPAAEVCAVVCDNRLPHLA